MHKERLFSLGSLVAMGFLGLVPLASAQNKARESIENPAVLSANQKKEAAPDDIFLEAYKLTSAAENLTKSGDDKAALTALTKAESYLKVLAESYPEWSPNVVQYRRGLNAKTMVVLRKRVQDKEALNAPKKNDFLDNSLIHPEKGGVGPGSSSSFPIRDRSSRELALEKRLREVLDELNKLKAHSQSTEDALKDSTRVGVAREARLKELEGKLQELQNAPKSAREQELEKELTELRKFKDTNSSEREKKLAAELDALKSTSLENRARKEEELQRQIKILNQVVSDKTQRELDLELQLKKLKTQQDRMQSDREIMLQKRLEETMAQLTAANARAERNKLNAGEGAAAVEYERLNQEYQRSQVELKAVTKVLKETRTETEEQRVRAIRAESGESAFKAQLASLRKQMKADQDVNNKVLATYNKDIKRLEERIQESLKEKEESGKKLSQLEEQLTQTEAQLADVTKQRDDIQLERNQIADLIQLNNPEKTKALLDENIHLAHQLKETQDKLAAYQASESVQTAQVQQMQTELALVKQRMIELRDENTGYRKRISQLSEKLRVTDVELEKKINQPDADPKLVEENKILRELISKQLRTLAARENARELLIAAYKRLKLQDPQMSNAIQMLDQSLELTDSDKVLLADTDKVRNANAILVAPGNPTPEARAQAFAKLQVEMEALGKGASDAYGKGRYAAAEQLYQTLLDRNPGHYAAHINLGVTLLKMNRAEEAQKVLQNAVDLDPEHPTGQFLLGVALYRTGRDAGAQMALTASTQADPANAKAYFYLGNIAASAGKTAAAIKNYQKTLELDASLIDVYYNMSSSYLNAGMVNDARKSYDLAIRAGALPDPELEKRLRITTPVVEDKKDNKSEEIKADKEDVKDKKEEVKFKVDN